MRDGCNVKATTTTTTIKAYKSRQRVTSARRPDKQGFLQKRGDHRPCTSHPSPPPQPDGDFRAIQYSGSGRDLDANALTLSMPSSYLRLVSFKVPQCERFSARPCFPLERHPGGTDVVRIGFCLWNGCSFSFFFYSKLSEASFTSSSSQGIR